MLGAQTPVQADVREKAGKASSSTHESPGHVEPLCGRPKPHEFTCFGLRRTDVAARRGLRAAKDAPEGFGPADLRSAYGLPADGGAGQTIAIVDAYDNPNAEADLAVYRAQYGLPACTTANGCFTKVDQRGGTHYPDPHAGWATEISLDLDMVSAVAPNARILLVEADRATAEDLGAAVDQAVALGAKYVSNSYGSSGEYPEESATDAHFDHPGVAIVASSGDDGYGVSYPAAAPHVTSVGGTTLTKDSGASRGWSESVWNHDGNGTGSGCSLYESKPVFQKDTGCDGHTVADVSAVADPATGVAVYDTYGENGGWGVAGGTSASAPIVAGVYANAGTPVAGTYPNAYPYAGGGSGLHDVTTGSNGKCSPAYLCTAGTGYDGPTGLGTPDGLSGFRMGPHGTLTGTVTDTATGAPVAGAEVTAGVYTATTDSRGHYDLPLPVGSHEVHVAVYGYAPGEERDVQVTDGGTVNRDFALRKLATHRVSGTVTDGSGHGWPLHAKITVDGVPGAPVWSDAYTGAYRLDLPENHTYTLRVVSDDTHYQPLVRQVAVGDADQSLGLALPVDTWAAGNPAYTLKVDTVNAQSFNSASGAPKGWKVVDVAGTGHGWVFDDPGHRGNRTGGSGGFAIADSDHAGGNTAFETLLVSPVYDFRRAGDPELTFNTDFEPFGDQAGVVEVTSDGGRTWTTVWHQNAEWTQGRVEIPLTAYAGRSAVQVRFHYTGPGMFWAVDDVKVAERVVEPVRGGVLTGTVSDVNTGRGLVGAAVRTGTTSGPSAPTTATTGDPRVGDGLYRLFVPGGGRHTFVASKPSYSPATRTVAVAENHVAKGSFVLEAGRLSIGTTRIETTTGPHGTVARKVTVRNTGTAPATLRIGERTGTGPGAGTPATAWRKLPKLPVPLMDNAVETYQGKVYSAFGSRDGFKPTAGLYVYNPSTRTWTKRASAPAPRMGTAHGFIGGRLYTAGGGQGPQDPASRTMQVYDPAHNKWTKGPSMPKARIGAASAVLDGRLYVVGGCTVDGDGCSNTVYVFDPSSGKWSKAANYPESIGWISCGAINGKLYCAGGSPMGDVETSAAYVYDPASDRWQSIADLPLELAGSTYAAVNGRLLVSGGATPATNGRSRPTSRGYAYDPGTDTWSALPDAPTAVYRGGGAPGLYRVGGSTDSHWYIPVASAAVLPGYDQTESDVPWMSETPQRLTLRPGQSASFTVTLHAGKMGRTGDWTASLVLRGDTPYWVPPVPVRVHIVKSRTP